MRKNSLGSISRQCAELCGRNANVILSQVLIFDSETSETDDELSFVVRYQISDKEAEEKLAAGL